LKFLLVILNNLSTIYCYGDVVLGWIMWWDYCFGTPYGW